MLSPRASYYQMGDLGVKKRKKTLTTITPALGCEPHGAAQWASQQGPQYLLIPSPGDPPTIKSLIIV